MKPKSFVVLCEFGTKREAECIHRLQLLAAKLLPHTEPIIVVVDNAETIDFEQAISNSITKVSGDNTNREFSAYDKGLSFLKSKYPTQGTDPIIIANDTFFTNYGDAYLAKFNVNNVRSTLQQNGVIGHMDAYPKPIALFGFEIQNWIRSSFLISKLAILTRIGQFSLPFPDAEIFSPDIGQFFNESVDLSENYQRYIKTWLFDNGQVADNFNQTWHSKAPLNKDNFASLKSKAKCILSEHFFSARARRFNIPLFKI